MPGLDGFALTERLKHSPELAGGVILMLSSISQPSDAIRGRELGAGAHVIKPVKASDLRRAILVALNLLAPGEVQLGVYRGRSPGTPRRLRVLLAEDNPVNQKLAVRLLESRGHSIVVAGNGREALAALESQPFDLVLMDVQMPGMDGLEATTAIRRREAGSGRRIPIIAMTAYAMLEDRERCLRAGMDRYLAKPFRIDELFEAIDSVTTPTDGPEPKRAEPVRPEPLVDWRAALTYVGNDQQLLRDLVKIFFEECPRWLEELRRAVAVRDAVNIKRLAHNIKGAMCHFGARSAFDAALHLEEMGSEAGLEEAYTVLEEQIEKLKPALASFASGDGEMP
jgi:CheY-like chemotaxis protein